MLSRPALAASVLLPLLAAAPARADLWGWVDERGRAHLADHQVDARYMLFRKDPPRPPAPQPEVEAARELPESVPPRWRELVARTAREHGLDAALLHAIIMVESNYDAAAVSPKGAVGLMQVLPQTAARFGVGDLRDPAQNLRAGALYLKTLLELFDRDLELVLAAYNAGEGAVMRHGNAIPPYAETRSYVPRVLARYRDLRL